LLDRIDRALTDGAIHATLPDGSRRTLGGRLPGFECEVRLASWNALLRLGTGGSAGWYRAWEKGEWSSPDPVPLFALFMRHAHSLGDVARAKGPFRAALALGHALRRNTRQGARRNVAAHYDLGNDFYEQWLDPTMTYSSAVGPGKGLEAGQREKQALLADRLGDAHRVLEIGCGWGSLAGYLAGRGMDVTAISLSGEQLAWARRQHPSPQFLLRDYRDVGGSYDAIVSVEMVEALGREYWPGFLDCIARNLAPGGRAALQFISIRDDLFERYAASCDFIQAHVFPGGLLINLPQFRELAAKRGLTWKDQHDFGPDYALTLQLWRERFARAVAERRLPPRFDARFCRLWQYYLQYCEGGFRGGGIDVHQVTLVKPA
jgi:cyclopropane-fatty-acyl-phospholipid synthase